ncbi:3-oxoacyl-[acyl-carrier-protein] reductase [Helicobacter monodelphidis]|uniref:3-oxoacyl-ACP reductase FabG n=1 Tax=Helicobacter sp. 15-1451 TaxID=2004995 RepID=UPI000DCBF481|nr:3-oxoacyl-ACP reductase FabG [Helicobacter sp. 15-1451]RAX57589.1 3-oxoacyl-[acyl-carrier-protein] reductase [Helicobacter sp. 15-1451]
MKFSKKNVLVTGGSRGIGAEICKVLAKMGLKVWINYRSNKQMAEDLKDEIEKDGGQAAILLFDATNEEEFVAAFKVICDSDGECGYLVNNAGITNDKLALRMKVQDFNQILTANLTSAFIGSREALKVMSKQRFGSVVNLSSIVGERGNMGQCNYAASKGGIISLTKSLALEGASRNVRFNAIAPGFISTEMTDTLKDEIKAEYTKNIPLGRFGTTTDVAYAVAYLLSDYASYITGEVLRVNGGLYM